MNIYRGRRTNTKIHTKGREKIMQNKMGGTLRTAMKEDASPEMGKALMTMQTIKKRTILRWGNP